MRLYIKWRPWKIDTTVDYGDFKLGGGYSLAFRYNACRKWYVDNCHVRVLDQLVTDYVDIGRISGNPRKDKFFAVIEYDETRIDGQELSFDIENDYKDYGIKVLYGTEPAEFLRDFTTCPEDNGTFILRQEYTDPITQEVTPAYTVTL